MDYIDIHDPTGEYDFALDWSHLKSAYTPEVIQEMIEDRGVREMVRTVNEHCKLTYGWQAMSIAPVGGRLTVVPA